MTELEQDKIRKFLADNIMVEAVKKVLMSVMESDLSKYADFKEDNNRLGEEIRALAKGKELVNQGFDKLLTFIKGETPIKKINKAI